MIILSGTKINSVRRRLIPNWVLLALLALLLLLSPQECLYASGGGHGGGGGGGGGGGFGFGIQFNLDLSRGLRPPPGAVDTEKHEEILDVSTDSDENRPKAQRKSVEMIPSRKLVSPRVLYLNELAMDIDKTLIELARKDPASAVKLYKNALAQAQKRRDLLEEMTANESLGHIYFLTGQFQKGAESYEKVLKIARGVKNSELEAVALRNLAAIHIAWADYDDAEAMNQEALKLFDDRSSSRGAQMTLNNIAVMEKNRGRFNRAAQDYARALEANKEANLMQIKTLTNLGNLFAARGEPVKASESFQAAADLSGKIADSKAQGEALLNLSKVQLENGEADKALENSKRALDSFYKVGAPPDYAKKLIGDICLDLGKTQEAESYIKESDFDSSLGRLYLVKGDIDSSKKTL